MGFQKNFFPQEDGFPEPLLAKTQRRVRFEEVDALGMVWHGRYPSYLEDGRIAFGDTYGLTYQNFQQHGVMAPVVQMHLEYTTPLRFDEQFFIHTRLHWSEAARLNFSYMLLNTESKIVARGYTVQLLTDLQGSMMLITPQWIEQFKEDWKSGIFSSAQGIKNH